MGVLRLTPERQQVIRKLAAEAAREGKHDWIRNSATATGGLPVYRTWVGALVISVEGDVLDANLDEGTVKPVTDPVWINIGKLEAVRKFPELHFLKPVRPLDARDCTFCKGTGTVVVDPGNHSERRHEFDCGRCGAVGWVGRDA